MSETFAIAAQKRETKGRKTNALRAQGTVPAVMYGFETEPVSLELDRNDLTRLYTKAGESSVIALSVDGTDHNVLIQDLQRDPLTDDITHADFRRINMNEKVEAAVRITLEGTSAAVKDMGGTLIQSLEEVDVVCLPSALIREFVVDISKIETFEDVIRVSDLTVPEGMELQVDAERTIATVQPPRKQEELDKLDEEVEENVDDVEVTSEKKDDAEGGEGGDDKKEEKAEEGKDDK